MCLKRIILSKNKKVLCNHTVQSKQKQLYRCKDSHLTTWNKVCLEIMSTKIEDMFNCFWLEYHFLFFTNKSAMQTTPLHDSPVIKLPETAMQCMLHGAYCENWV